MTHLPPPFRSIAKIGSGAIKPHTHSTTIPSTSALLPTIQSETFLLPILLPTTTTTSPSNNLNTFASSLSTEVPPVLATANKLATLSTEVEPSVSLSESAAPISNNEHFETSKIPKPLKQN
ncbi:hypothetical protein TNCV_3606231 [Trichonephila clavipes]|nr:hypothetical protein TNCV_3606231 [Trichonephila clavipes]